MRTATDPGPLDPSVDVDGFVRHRYAVLAALRDQAPAVFVPAVGLWAVTRYDTVRAVLGDPDRFPSGGSFGASTRLAPAAARHYDFTRPIFRHSLINTDRGEHARLKAPLVAAFSAHRIRTLSKAVAEDTAELLDAVAAALHGGKPVDLRALFTGPLPLGTLCRLFGIPRADGPAISHESQAVSLIAAPGLPEAVQVDAATRLAALDTRLRRLVADRDARAALDDGLIRDVLAARDRGDNDLTDDELVGNLGGLVFAGHETTVNTLTNAVARLLRDRDLWTALGGGRVDLDRLVDELLRLDTSVIGLYRPAGATLWPSFAAANRDPARFPDPDRLDLQRPRDQRHLTFGHGVHHCMGALLAQMQIRTAVDALTRSFPSLHLDGDAELRETPRITTRGIERLPVTN